MAHNSPSTVVSSDHSHSAGAAFARSLEGFRRRLSAEDLENFQLTTFSSLELAIKEIQRDQAQRRALRNLNRVKPFLTANVRRESGHRSHEIQESEWYMESKSLS